VQQVLKGILVLPAQQVPQVRLACRGLQVLQVHRDQQVKLDLQVFPARRAQMGNKDPRVQQVYKDLLVLLVL
jgi:hypothetical protein